MPEYLEAASKSGKTLGRQILEVSCPELAPFSWFCLGFFAPPFVVN